MNIRWVRKISFFLLLSVCFCLLVSCSRGDAKRAGEAVLDACIACDSSVYGAIMGGQTGLTLTDTETYVLRRMTYRTVGVREIDETHAVYTADLKIFDMMNLLNTAFQYSLAAGTETAFDPNVWILEMLNTDSAEYGMFRVMVPLILVNGKWALEREGDLESLRDGVSGGSYSWWKLYTEFYLGETSTTEEP